MLRVGSFRRSSGGAEGAEAGGKGEGFAEWDALGEEAREGRIRRRGRDEEGEDGSSCSSRHRCKVWRL